MDHKGKNVQKQQRQEYKGDGRIESHPLLMSDTHWNRLEAVCRRAFRSGILPKGVSSEEAAFTIALKGISLGLDPMYAMEHISIINGKASIDGQAMLALFYRSGKISVKFERSPNPLDSCSVTMRRAGQDAVTVTWTMERARRADLLRNPSWQKYPDQMLRWRAVSECGRIVAPDILGGLYLHEEMGAVVDEEGKVVQVDPARVERAKPVTEPTVDEKTEAEVIALPAVPEKEPAPEDPVTEADHRSFVDFYHGHGWQGAEITEQIRVMFGRERFSELAKYQLNALMVHVEQHPKPKSAEELAAEAVDRS